MYEIYDRQQPDFKCVIICKPAVTQHVIRIKHDEFSPGKSPVFTVNLIILLKPFLPIESWINFHETFNERIYIKITYLNAFLYAYKQRHAEIQANAKQHHQAELLLFENYSHPWYHPKIIGYILKNKQKNKCFNKIIRLIIMKMKMKMKKRSHRHNINRPRSRRGHKYSKC